MAKRAYNFIDRTGEVHITNSGHKTVIVEYIDGKNCIIQFEDGVLKNVEYHSLQKGLVKKPLNRIGEVYETKQGYKIEILEYFHSRNITIKFENGAILQNISYPAIVKGILENPYHPTVYNIGFRGVGKYNCTNSLPIFYKWYNMFIRCYDKEFQEKCPTYIGCSVDERWYNFQVFAEWYENNWKDYMIRWDLDKDILVEGSKTYSPETCCFVPQEINKLLQIHKTTNRKLPIGVIEVKGRYTARITKYNKTYHIGTFDSIEEASEAYRNEKELHIKKIAEFWKNRISTLMYNKLINYKVKIQD